MGVKLIIRQEVTKVRLNSHLAQFGEPGIDIHKRIFQHFAMLRVLRCFKLLEDSLPGEVEPITLPSFGQLFGSKLRLGFVYAGNCFGLLFLYRFTFPPSRHEESIPGQRTAMTVVSVTRCISSGSRSSGCSKAQFQLGNPGEARTIFRVSHEQGTKPKALNVTRT